MKLFFVKVNKLNRELRNSRKYQLFSSTDFFLVKKILPSPCRDGQGKFSARQPTKPLQKVISFEFRNSQKLNRGFTLVETLVAIAIFTTSILGLMLVLAAGIYNTNYAKNKITASYLAQEGIEYIRNMRDTYGLYTAVTRKDWNNFKAKLAPCNSGSECGFDNSVVPIDVKKCNQLNDCKLFFNNGSYNSSVGADSGFIRKVWVNVIDQDKEIKIFSNVFWTQGSGSYSITFSENLFNWIE